MNFSDFMANCGITKRLDFYPYTNSCFDNLTEDEKSLLALDATYVSPTNIHSSNFNFLDEASPDLVLLWSLKALSEMGGRIHEDDLEVAEENDCYYVCIIFEGVEDGVFYIETKKEEKGVRYKVWGSYSDSKQQVLSQEYLPKIKKDPSKIIDYLLNSAKVEEQEGVISYSDFGFDSDDILIGLRKSVASFKKSEEQKAQLKGLI